MTSGSGPGAGGRDPEPGDLRDPGHACTMCAGPACGAISPHTSRCASAEASHRFANVSLFGSFGEAWGRPVSEVSSGWCTTRSSEITCT